MSYCRYRPSSAAVTLLPPSATICHHTYYYPNSFYEAKRKLRNLGLGYETIHACKYDCVLYWKEFADLQHCPTCGEAGTRDKLVGTDDVLRHSADAEGWKHFDSEYLDFASNPQTSPDREIDVYLQPLIEELKELWTFGLRTYDSLTDRPSGCEVEYLLWDIDAIF
ncbi:uncharacterized protein E6C27_scaffold498G00310 [Cucumis melo var. makuwa]|uniref:Transposase n=1 Tax=Cucumis melo var. makuwa TaxID=1194695 RepID=A0A5A7TX03_CUCMM|nr:uncharacterized protein E6C27_scaffold498G00310 [Cucumis melo var. makuwa]